MDLRKTARELLPPVVVRGLQSLRSSGRIRFTGPYATWAEATAASQGYDAPAILERVREAALAIRGGKAAFERDAVTFDRPEPPFPLLAVLLRAALANGGVLHVLDVGGSLGSTYYPCRAFLHGVPSLRWSIVEQPAFVECGRREFETAELRFFERVEDAARDGAPQVALLSSVLQYLEDPAATARAVAVLAPGAIVVDRTPVHERPDDALMVQHVPPSIYEASYPFRVFSRARLLSLFGPGYRATAELPTLAFESLERDLGARYVGQLFERNAP